MRLQSRLNWTSRSRKWHRTPLRHLSNNRLTSWCIIPLNNSSSLTITISNNSLTSSNSLLSSSLHPNLSSKSCHTLSSNRINNLSKINSLWINLTPTRLRWCRTWSKLSRWSWAEAWIWTVCSSRFNLLLSLPSISQLLNPDNPDSRLISSFNKSLKPSHSRLQTLKIQVKTLKIPRTLKLLNSNLLWLPEAQKTRVPEVVPLHPQGLKNLSRPTISREQVPHTQPLPPVRLGSNLINLASSNSQASLANNSSPSPPSPLSSSSSSNWTRCKHTSNTNSSSNNNYISNSNNNSSRKAPSTQQRLPSNHPILILILHLLLPADSNCPRLCTMWAGSRCHLSSMATNSLRIWTTSSSRIFSTRRGTTASSSFRTRLLHLEVAIQEMKNSNSRFQIADSTTISNSLRASQLTQDSSLASPPANPLKASMILKTKTTSWTKKCSNLLNWWKANWASSWSSRTSGYRAHPRSSIVSSWIPVISQRSRTSAMKMTMKATIWTLQTSMTGDKMRIISLTSSLSSMSRIWSSKWPKLKRGQRLLRNYKSSLWA
jgi:hypothetical protein